MIHIKPERDESVEANAVVPEGQVVWAVDRVNHGQVGSGVLPDTVINQVKLGLNPFKTLN